MMLVERIRHLLGIEPDQSIAQAYLATPQPRITARAVCHTCRRYHDIAVIPSDFAFETQRWYLKHPIPGHQAEFYSVGRSVPRGLFDKVFQEFNVAPWWLDSAYEPNADIKPAYETSAAYTCGIEVTPLASSSTGVLGRESTAVSNTTAKDFDYLVGGKVTTGTSPTAGVISIYLYGSVNDTPTYPDVLDGTDSDETFTSADIRNAAVSFFNETVTDTTSNRTYWFRPMCISQFFGGFVPKNHGLFVTHTTVAALHATGSNHVLNYTGLYVTG